MAQALFGSERLAAATDFQFGAPIALVPDTQQTRGDILLESRTFPDLLLDPLIQAPVRRLDWLLLALNFKLML